MTRYPFSIHGIRHDEPIELDVWAPDSATAAEAAQRWAVAVASAGAMPPTVELHTDTTAAAIFPADFTITADRIVVWQDGEPEGVTPPEED